MCCMCLCCICLVCPATAAKREHPAQGEFPRPASDGQELRQGWQRRRRRLPNCWQREAGAASLPKGGLAFAEAAREESRAPGPRHDDVSSALQPALQGRLRVHRASLLPQTGCLQKLPPSALEGGKYMCVQGLHRARHASGNPVQADVRPGASARHLLGEMRRAGVEAEDEVPGQAERSEGRPQQGDPFREGVGVTPGGLLSPQPQGTAGQAGGQSALVSDGQGSLVSNDHLGQDALYLLVVTNDRKIGEDGAALAQGGDVVQGAEDLRRHVGRSADIAHMAVLGDSKARFVHVDVDDPLVRGAQALEQIHPLPGGPRLARWGARFLRPRAGGFGPRNRGQNTAPFLLPP